MNRLAFAAVTGIALAFAATADTYITEEPEDTSMIKVGAGTTTVGGAGVFDHMFVHMAFDPNQAMNYNSVTNGPTLSYVSSQCLSFTNDEERGESVYTGDAGAFKLASDKLDPRIPTDMTKPFTAAFWVKVTEGCTQPSARMFYLGPTGRTATEGESIDCFWGNDKTRKALRFCGGGDSAYSFAESQIDKWIHLALVCTPTNVTEEARLTVGLFVNGRRVKDKNIANFTNDAANVSLWIARSASGTTTACSFFNHIMMFDTALTADEIAFVQEYTEPLDFSAGWDIDANGTLKLQGGSAATALIGAGVYDSVEPAVLTSSSNGWFGGSVVAPSFTFAGADASVTQTLAGVNASAGAVTVQSGTLEIAPDPTARQVFGDALVAWYSFDDPEDLGHDYSGRGNHLSPATADLDYYSQTNDAAVVDGRKAIHFGSEKTHNGLYSGENALKGFKNNQDNAFTLSGWARWDRCMNQEGPFSFGTYSCVRVNNESGTSVYAGDNGKLWSTSGSLPIGGKWHHYALFYDPTADESARFTVFIDGKFKAVTKCDPGYKHAGTYFSVGATRRSASTCWFNGSVDEVIVLNTCNTNDIAKLYGFRRATKDYWTTPVLPTTARVDVANGATMSLRDAANETVSQLFGDGDIYLDEFSILRVTDKYRFKGQVLGEGQLIVDPAAEPKGISVLVR